MQMDQSIKENMKTINLQVKDFIYGKMVRDMKDNGKMVYFMVRESNLSLMEQSMMESGLMENQMEWVLVNIRTALNTQATGQKVNHQAKD